MVFLMVLTLWGCGGSGDTTQTTEDDGIVDVVLLVNGNLGDMSFFDSANRGIERLNDEYGDVIDARTIEMGTNQSNWETTLYRVSEQDYDLIICATTQMREPLQRVSNRYPDKHYIIFDSEVDEGKSDEYDNVHSILFRQNEGGFLAGVLAARMANGSSGMTAPVTASGLVGFIGGMRNNIIYDFAVGYAEGIQYVNEHADQDAVAMQHAFVGNFSDSTQAKALANIQYDNGSDVIFVAASQAGLGVIDSAQTKNKYVIGVDSDQYEYYADTNPERAELIVTSVLKKVGTVIFDSVVDFKEGTLEFGVLKSYGLSEGIIGLADNENYRAKVPEALRSELADLETQIINEELLVTSRFDLTLDQIDALFAELN